MPHPASAPEVSRAYLRQQIGAEIRRLRRRMGKTQMDACVEVFGDERIQPSWSKWERGLLLPQLATLERIARWGGVSMEVFSVLPSAERPSVSEIEEVKATLLIAMELEDIGSSARDLIERAYLLMGGSVSQHGN